MEASSIDRCHTRGSLGPKMKSLEFHVSLSVMEFQNVSYSAVNFLKRASPQRICSDCLEIESSSLCQYRSAKLT